MANLRIVYSNAADRATLTATAGVGTMVKENLLLDTKSKVWRTASTSATITLIWTTAEIIGAVALPFCNLSPTATIRVRGYTNSGDASPVGDSGTALACPIGSGGWVGATGVNTYAYAGGRYATSWFTKRSVKKIVIDIVDTSNTLGYIEASRVVAGDYWSPTNNVEHGSIQLATADRSKNERTDSGDLRTDRGTMHKRVSLDLSLMPAADRNSVWSIARGNGMFKPVFFSLSPQGTDVDEEQAFCVYGKQTQQNSTVYQFTNQFSTTLELEEI